MSVLNKRFRKHAYFHSAGRINNDKKWIIPFFICFLIWITLISSLVFLLLNSSSSSSYQYHSEPLQFDLVSDAKSEDSKGYFVEMQIKKPYKDSKEEPPRFAYLISGTKGDSKRMMRTLQAVYHPRNLYILHMDLDASLRERLELKMWIKNDATFSELSNVRLMVKSNLVTYKGPTMIAATLHAIAILLKESLKWDWFINLSASDYPLVTQDGKLYKSWH